MSRTAAILIALMVCYIMTEPLHDLVKSIYKSGI